MEDGSEAVRAAVARASRRLTPTERMIIAFLAEYGERPCSKERISTALGRSHKTIDRLMSRLRHEGLVTEEFQWAESGGQLPSIYRLTS